MGKRKKRSHDIADPLAGTGRDAPHADSTFRPTPWAFPAGLLALALATCAAFWGVLGNGWIALDDPEYVTENAHVAAGWARAGAAWFLTHTQGGNWHPLTSWSHVLDVQLFGLNPAAHHAVNLALHVANALLLVVLLRLLTGSTARALLAGALFALHPLRVESVAWASERKDVLSGLFFLLTLLAYRRWTLRPGAARAAIVATTLALGLLAKPMLVTTPLVLLLLDVWPLRRGGPWTARMAEKWPLFALSAAAAVVTFAVQSADGAVVAAAHSPLAHRVANAALSAARYVGLTLWPARLAAFHPDAPVAPWLALACVAALVAISLLALRRFRAHPSLALGWSWYLVMLLPVIGLVQVGGQAFADRYTYLPALGLVLAAVWTPVPTRAAKPLFAAGLAAALALAAATRAQVALWKDTRTLFTHALRVAGESAMAHDCLGAEAARAGRVDAAVAHYEAAIRLQPADMNAWLNLAALHRRQGRNVDAVRCYEAVRASRPHDADLACDEAAALVGAGRAGDAIALLRPVLAAHPDRADALRPLGEAQMALGRYDEALVALRRATALAPHDAAAQHALAQAIYASGGAASDAVAHLRQAVAAAPGWAEPRATLAMLLATAPGAPDAPEAVRHAARAVELTGGRDGDALSALALAYAAAGRPDSARSPAHEAMAIAERSGDASAVARMRARLARVAGALRR